MVDLKRSNDPIWFTDVYRVDTENNIEKYKLALF
jgi:hypothetical protein